MSRREKKEEGMLIRKKETCNGRRRGLVGGRERILDLFHAVVWRDEYDRGAAAHD